MIMKEMCRLVNHIILISSSKYRMVILWLRDQGLLAAIEEFISLLISRIDNSMVMDLIQIVKHSRDKVSDLVDYFKYFY